MSNPIDRQAAIDAIVHATFDVTIGGRRGFQNYKEEFEKAFVAIRDRYIEALKALPPAQPDRSLWFRIGEICVDESKGFISADRAVEKIRELLREAERKSDA